MTKPLCKVCGDRMREATPEDLEEAKKIWGDFDLKDMVAVCDDYYKNFMEWTVEHNPEALTKKHA